MPPLSSPARPRASASATLLAALAIAIVAGACTPIRAAARPDATEPCPPGPSALVVVIDGARFSETLGDPARAHITQTWQRVAATGAWSDSFYNDGLTETIPGHSAILTGTWQPIANDGFRRPTRPTLFEYFRAHTGLPAQCAVVVGGKGKLAALAYSTSSGYGPALAAEADTADRSDRATWDALRARLDTTRPRLVLLSLSDVDRRGHANDWPGYLAALQTADGIVGELWDYALATEPYRGRAALIVTNDHGRSATDLAVHTGDENSRRIMLVAAGPGVDPTGRIDGRRTQIELAASIGALLGIPTPEAAGAAMPWARPIGPGAWTVSRLPLVVAAASSR